MPIYGVDDLAQLPASNPAIFIAVGSTSAQNAPILMTTENADAATWIDRSSAAATAAAEAVLQDVCYSASLDRWVAVGYNGGGSFGDPNVIYSDNGGSTWNAATADPSADFMINSVCWTGAAFIAVGKASGSNTPKVMSSANGISWTVRTSDPTTNVEWRGANGIAGLAVAVGGVSSPKIMTSANDGSSWTARTPGSVGSIGQMQDVICIPSGTHVAVGFSSVSTGAGVITSTDGTTWTGVSFANLPDDHQYYGIAHNGSIYVAVGSDFNTSFEGRAASSTAPASSWTARTTDPVAVGDNGPNWLSVAALNAGGFVAVGHDNNGFNIPYIMYSADGLSWSARTPVPATNAILLGVGSSG